VLSNLNGREWNCRCGYDDLKFLPGIFLGRRYCLSDYLWIFYLTNNRVLSADFFFNISIRSNGPCCIGASTPGAAVTSGNAICGDLTAVHKFGK
jgi:hypothetical protein